jgi:glycosyltransferase involved in cell wall biosynthesis
LIADLSIKIITFNRARKLEKTLERIASTSLGGYPIEVIDNASTDQTPAILDRFRERMPCLQVYRHRQNIGVYSNILRAYERFDTRYCWVVCDDDYYDVAALELLLAAISEGKHDVYLVGAPGALTWELGYDGTTRHLHERGCRLYHAMSFLPAFVFDRKFLQNEILLRCYKAASAPWPHAPLMEAIIESDSRISVLKKQIVKRFPADDVQALKVSPLYEIARSGYHLSARYRARYMVDMLDLQEGATAKCIRLAGAEKFQGNLQAWQTLLVLDVMSRNRLRHRMAIAAAMLIPTFVYRLVGILLGKRVRTGSIPLELSTRM